MRGFALGLLGFICGIVICVVSALSSNQIHSTKTDAAIASLKKSSTPLRTQSEHIRQLSEDPNNLFVCQYAERLERVAEDYSDAQIETEIKALIRDRGTPIEQTHRDILTSAESDKRKLAALRTHNCIDITKLITPENPEIPK